MLDDGLVALDEGGYDFLDALWWGVVGKCSLLMFVIFMRFCVCVEGETHCAGLRRCVVWGPCFVVEARSRSGMGMGMVRVVMMLCDAWLKLLSIRYIQYNT